MNKFDEIQKEVLSRLSDTLARVNDAGLTIKAGGPSGLAIIPRDIINKLLSGEELPDNIEYGDVEKTLTQELNNLMNDCCDKDILFSCGPEGMYVIDKNYYKTFMEEHPDSNNTEEETIEFQSHIVKIDDKGAYFQMKQSCSCCGTDCEECPHN